MFCDFDKEKWIQTVRSEFNRRTIDTENVENVENVFVDPINDYLGEDENSRWLVPSKVPTSKS